MKNAEIAAMETKMSKVAGAAVELTIRAERAFSFTTNISASKWRG